MSAEISMKINWKSNEKIFKQKSWKTKAQFYEVHFVMVDLTTEDLKTIRVFITYGKPKECTSGKQEKVVWALAESIPTFNRLYLPVSIWSLNFWHTK